MHIANIILQLPLANTTYNFYVHHQDTQLSTSYVFVVVVEASNML